MNSVCNVDSVRNNGNVPAHMWSVQQLMHVPLTEESSSLWAIMLLHVRISVCTPATIIKETQTQARTDNLYIQVALPSVSLFLTVAWCTGHTMHGNSAVLNFFDSSKEWPGNEGRLEFKSSRE